jgi:hypothetical protein
MGWMRTILLGDIGNRMDIADAEDQISFLQKRQSQQARLQISKQSHIEHLRSELEKQRLATTTLSRFLIEKEIISAEELDDFIKVVDAEDGVIDGKLALETTKLKNGPIRKRLILKEGLPDGIYRKP